MLSGTSHPRELEKGELWSSQHIPVPLLNCSIPTEDGEGTFSNFTSSPGAAGRDDQGWRDRVCLRCSRKTLQETRGLGMLQGVVAMTDSPLQVDNTVCPQGYPGPMAAG